MEPKFNREIEKIDQLISESKKIYISSHMNPDGDSIGSIIGFGKGLLKKYPNVNIRVAIRDAIPEYLSFLDTSMVENIMRYEKADLLFALDCGDENRLGIDGLDKIDTIVNMDHHITNPLFGDINIVDTEASSTCEIVYNTLAGLGVELDLDIARPIYTGLSSDTGSFKYRSTGVRTHQIAGELLSTGMETEDIVRSLYQSNTMSQVTLIKESIENMELYRDGEIAILLITDEILESAGMSAEEVDSIVEFLRDIDTVEISAVLKKYDDKVKISLRSKDKYDVSEIAKVFNGGGHMRAAGCKYDGDMEEAKRLLLEEIEKRS